MFSARFFLIQFKSAMSLGQVKNYVAIWNDIGPILYPVLTFQSTPLVTWVIPQKQYFLELMLYNLNSYCFALNKYPDFVDI